MKDFDFDFEIGLISVSVIIMESIPYPQIPNISTLYFSSRPSIEIDGYFTRNYLNLSFFKK